MYANDLSREMLGSLEMNIPRDQKSRLTLMPGNVMDIEFPRDSLGAIFALRFMHFLTGDEFRRLFKSYYDWLSPGGILVVTCANSLYHFINSFQNEYKLNLKLDLEWPCEIHLTGNLKIKYKNCFLLNKIIYFLYNKIAGNLNPFKIINFISLDVLIREATRAGFHIIKANYIGRDLRENYFTKFGKNKENFSSIIAVKDIFKV